ncbi:AmmeMemoRadiSam system radical SAM enzyme [Sulfodiicoccus acidiphilus]|uniref:AmmeMemoRadiSam system radical SAM enzyme n=1 Tax=Sulfodiicoccus acidiphilus TaxID=1670455 RepID=A0A348B0U8_9CREN|nr:AmmeMemoRadiSam system radical SAM enzyme [Sulfodiicoccus acidiphilus]GGT99273.1 AmmeMemoRadiSam system radical SAM enzyme [Sulfodiicoccus acidiphilus]
MIGEGQSGFCGVRSVKGGKLHLDVYGLVEAAHVDPIEKKPLVHFNPGSKVFSISTTGCSWMCMYCQNYEISQRRRVEGVNLSPKEVVELALAYGSDGVTYTYNEPMIFSEFAHDVAQEARKYGLFNTYVSNGYGTIEGVEYLSRFLDAITIDFKGNASPKFLRRYTGASGPEPILETAVELARRGVHVEFTDLVIPELGDELDYARKLVRFIRDSLGDEVPIHFLRFHPDYKMNNLPWTPVETLEAHYKIAKEEGMKYVYIGNVPGHPYESTYCPSCGRVVIGRDGFRLVTWNLDNNKRCRFCGTPIPIKGRLSRHAFEERFEAVYI